MLWYVFTLLMGRVICDQNVRKCCEDNQVLSLNSYECGENDKFPAEQTRMHLKNALKINHLNLVEAYGFPKCKDNDTFLNKQLDAVNQTMVGQFTDICADITNDNQNIIVACVPAMIVPFLSKRASIRKCCPMFEMVFKGIGVCNTSDQIFKPEFYDLHNFTKKLNMFAKDVDIITPGCKNKGMFEFEEGRLLANGSFYELAENKILDRDSFCVDNVIGLNETVEAFYCYSPKTDPGITMEYRLIATGLIISIFFLILTFLIYASNWKKQNSYGRSLVCHLGSMIIAYTCLAAVQLDSHGLVLPDKFCYPLAYVMLLSFLAAFFWLNIMCFDIWRTFRSIRARDSLQRGPKMLRFFLYSIYAWGMPIKLTFITMIVFSYQLLPEMFLPKINSCWFSREGYGYHLFFIAPISAIILCNLVLFIITAWKCYQVKKDIGKRLDKKRESNFAKKKEQLILSVKLFIVMGITWSMEVVSFLCKHRFQDSIPSSVWYATDAVNALYGLIIFLIFAIKKKNIRNMTRRVSAWVDKRRSGSESLINFRKISTTINTSTIDTSLGETGETFQTDSC